MYCSSELTSCLRSSTLSSRSDERLGAVRQPERDAIAVMASTTEEIGRETIGRTHEL